MHTLREGSPVIRNSATNASSGNRCKKQTVTLGSGRCSKKSRNEKCKGAYSGGEHYNT
jgi:hypothetical protein